MTNSFERVGVSSKQVTKSFKRVGVLSKRVTKSFERVSVSSKQVNKSFERVSVSIKRVTKLFERVRVLSKWVTKPFKWMQIFSNGLQTVVNGILLKNRKLFKYVFPCTVTYYYTFRFYTYIINVPPWAFDKFACKTGRHLTLLSFKKDFALKDRL